MARPNAYTDDSPITPFGGTGGLHSIGEPPQGSVAGVLWVPDVEARRGWREWYVRRDTPTSRPIGYRRNR